MIDTKNRRRRATAVVTATGFALAAALSGLSGPARAAATGDVATVVDPATNQPLDEGGSATPFTLKLPSGAACTGDSANQGYRIQSYIVGSSVDPATLQFGSNGPEPGATGANLRQPMYETTSDPYVNEQTAAANPTPGPGPIVNIPAFDYQLYPPGEIPAGTYNIGIACTLGPESTTQLDKYWNAVVSFTVDDADSPAEVHWTVEEGSGTTTTTEGGSTTTTEGGSTTTTDGGSTTTTTAGGSTSTTTGSTTTTTAASSLATVTDTSGTQLPSGSQLSRGQRVAISGSGFSPGETVSIVVRSTPVTVGSAVADSSGRVTATVTIPSSLEGGAHTISLEGAAKTLTFAFTTTSTGSSGSSGGGSSGSLPRTGLGAFAVLGSIATVLLGFGRVGVVLSRPPRVRRPWLR